MLTKPEHSEKLLFAHEIEAWQVDKEFIRSANRCTFAKSDHVDIYMTDAGADQYLRLLAGLSLACSK